MIVTEKQLDETDKKIIAKSAEGMTAKEIGRDLNITQRSVEARIREMKKWHKCSNMVELVNKIINFRA